MSEHVTTSSAREPFDKVGLAWGVLATTVTVGLAGGAVAAGSLGLTFEGLVTAFGMLFVGGAYAFMASILLAIFPIGPAAALFAWPLYRGGIRARSAFAVAGAAAGVTVPGLLAAFSNSTPSLINWSDPASVRVESLFIFGYFLLMGGFGGFMAGRVIRRASVT